MAPIDVKYDLWKNKLLDLGKRNKLINYKDTRMSSLKITSPDCSSLFDYFVKEEHPLVFPHVNDPIPSGMFSDPAVTALTIREEAIEDMPEEDEYSFIKTDKKPSDRQKVLRNLRNKAKTAMEEQGINMLYLSFGFLRYTEAAHATTILRAPLVLVPVTLTVESIAAPFILSLHEDEITLNPTLQYKLQQEYGMTLPTFDETCDLEQFFSQIQQMVSSNHWKVERDVGLSLLSFLKINMYADLDHHKEAIVSNPIVCAISGDNTHLVRIPENLDTYDFDSKEQPRNTFQIVDADASQQEAILLAKQGVSFVLQGPPGTGKSQTITNIIAESLSDGKKVLFVSEKAAALDVVYRRLQAAGLDDFCLVLHSYKANKRAVLDQLEKVLNLSQKKAKLSEDAYQQLSQLEFDRKQLNEYVRQLHTPIAPLGKTIYEANGVIANLSACREMIFDIPRIAETSKEKFTQYCSVLSRYVSIAGKMTGDVANNSWRGAIIPYVTNEFRHDVGAKLPVLSKKSADAFTAAESTQKTSGAVFELSVKGVERIITFFSQLEDAKPIPINWTSSADLSALFTEAKALEANQSNCFALIGSFLEKHAQLSQYTPLVMPEREELLSAASASRYLTRISQLLSDNEAFNIWKSQEEADLQSLLTEARKTAEEIAALKESLLDSYEPEILSLDYKPIRTRIRTEYTSFTKVFKASYKEDRKQLTALRKEAAGLVSGEELSDVIETLHHLSTARKWYSDQAEHLQLMFGALSIDENSNYDKLQALLSDCIDLQSIQELLKKLIHELLSEEKKKAQLQSRFPGFYTGVDTDWTQVQNALRWAATLRNMIRQYQPGSVVIERLCTEPGFADFCMSESEKLSSAIGNLEPELTWFENCFDKTQDLRSLRLDALEDRCNACANGLARLEEWLDLRTVREECCKIGLESYMQCIEKESISTQEILPIFKKRFYRLWLDAVSGAYPAVVQFRTKTQENRIHEFAELDRLQFNIARARIKGKLINELPSMDHFTSGVDEISILKRELKKQRKIMPIRKLFRAIPNLLLTLKPCLMMSPLSVSLFLEAESYLFDVVIFDEASQVYTENAIGAISRGKQVIIAGDSKQLPPTSFFQANTSESEYDTEDDNDEGGDVYESILDEANMFPERTLRWHYRSRHESLIAFSNAKIYKSNLITFPSNTEKSANNGVEYVHVPGGFYDRGGRKGNVNEARKVAELVFEHFRNMPDRSLGVIAFGEIQQMAIETELRRMRLENQSFEPFFAEDREEPFFVKSLENVQGDERDTIIFSIGYAKDDSGVFRNQFGPLGKAGGERRLNVAITRAKYNVKLVGSILPTDIDVDRISTEGPKLLRAYMEYAINGPESLACAIEETDIVSHDSPFEEAVYNFLDRKGYKLATQVGCSGYRIDMAVKHPSLSGIYVLGIECDGAMYHSARTARERDRLRQDVLEKMGWKIYRIWSTDWIKDPVSEGNKLLAAVEEAIASYGTQDTPKERKENNADYMNVEEKPRASSDPVDLYGFTHAASYSFVTLSKDYGGYVDIGDAIEMVVKNEYPIHYDLLCQRLAGLYGNSKATVKVRREVDWGLQKVSDRVLRKGDYLYPKIYWEIPIRMPNTRKIQHISTDELATAMLKILKTCVGTTREALASETSRVYGFSRNGQNITAAMAEAVQKLIDSGKAEEVEGKLRAL